MPARPPIPNAAKVTIGWTSPDGILALNQFYVQTTWDTTNVSNLNSLAALVSANVYASGFSSLLGQLSHAWQSGSVEVNDLSGTTATGSAGGTGAGAIAQPAVNPQTAMCIIWTINRRYRGGKPRMYIPGLPNNDDTSLDTRIWTSGAMTGVVTALDSLQTGVNSFTIGATTTAMGTISYVSGGAPRVTPLFEKYASGCRAQARLCNQRRRLGKTIGV